MSRNKEQAKAAGVRIADTHHHMNRRSPWHNYSSKNTYMLTLVVEGRRPLLGRLAGEGVATMGKPVWVELSALGRAIRDEEVKKIAQFYPMVEVWKLCIMPDHIHMIVRVKEDMPKGKHLGQVVSGFKAGCSRAWWRLMEPAGEPAGTGAARGPAGTGAAREPAGTGAAREPAGTGAGEETTGVVAPVPVGSPTGPLRPVLFEKGYCDKILLREGQLDRWKHYLDDNPHRLAVKRLRPDYFTVVLNAEVVGRPMQVVGNRFLLDNPDKMAVIVHGAYSDKKYAQLCEDWLKCGESGGVLISAAIATREKMVMREAMNRGYRVILLRENGFPPLYKPSGEAFSACAEGRLLQVSPWDYHMEHRTISREQCLQLNRLAEMIAAS